MKSLKHLSKGILISLVVAMMLGFGPEFCAPLKSLTAVPAAYAAQGEFSTIMAPIKEVEMTAESSAVKDDMVKSATKLAAWSHRLFAPMINFLAFQIGNFLGTDYIYNGNMGKMLQKIWVISRNLVNISFVFILLYMALNVIFNPKYSLSDFKNKLLMFVLLLVAVNFSWLATRVVLDASNVVTHVVFAIPSGIGTPPAYGQETGGGNPDAKRCAVNAPNEPATGLCYPTAFFAPMDASSAPPLYFEDTEKDDDNCAKVKKAYTGSDESAYGKEGKEINTGATAENKKFQRRTSICVENLNLTKYDMNTSVIYLTYGMARIQNLVFATGSSGEVIQLTVGFVLSLILQIAYTVSLLALFIALIIRMAMLWLFVAFSPFMVLVIFFSGAADQTLGKFKFGFTEFARWAFVPAKVGAVFAVTFIMISAGQATGYLKQGPVDNVNAKTGIVFQILEPQSLFMGIGSLQNFIWLLMCIVILWVGVFGVFEEMSLINLATGKIINIGRSVADIVATSPYWAPIIPLGKEGKMTSIEAQRTGLTDKYRKFRYGGENEPEDIRRLNQKAPDVDLADTYRTVNSGRQLTAQDAHRLATAYGFRDVKHMLTVDEKTLTEAYRKSKHNETGNEGKILEALRKVASPETAAAKPAPTTPPPPKPAEPKPPVQTPAPPAGSQSGRPPAGPSPTR